MTEPETDWSNLEKQDDLIRFITDNKKKLAPLASPSIQRIIDALDLALIGLDEVSDDYRKRAFVGLVYIQDLTDLYSFLKGLQ